MTTKTISKLVGIPINDYVVIRRIDPDESAKTSLIIIPESAKEKSQEGEVVAVGPGKPRDFLLPRAYNEDDPRNLDELSTDRQAPVVEVGMRVMFGKYAGYEIKVDGQDYTIMRENEIFMMLPE